MTDDDDDDGGCIVCRVIYGVQRMEVNKKLVKNKNGRWYEWTLLPRS